MDIIDIILLLLKIVCIGIVAYGIRYGFHWYTIIIFIVVFFLYVLISSIGDNTNNESNE